MSGQPNPGQPNPGGRPLQQMNRPPSINSGNQPQRTNQPPSNNPTQRTVQTTPARPNPSNPNGPPRSNQPPPPGSQPRPTGINPNAPPQFTNQPGMNRPPSVNGAQPPSRSTSTPTNNGGMSGSGTATPTSTNLRRGGPSPTGSSHSASPSPYPDRPPIEMEDDIPLVAEVYENQRYYPVVGWSAKMMDRPAWSNEEGTEAKEKDDFKVPPGWQWGGEWQIEIDESGATTDQDGWSYASDFTRRYRGSGDGSLKAVRRRRHFRRRIPPAKSVKVALGLAGGANANALTVGLVKNTLAVSNTVRSANGYSVMSHNSLSARAKKPAGGGQSLAELYAKQTVDPAPSATPLAASPDPVTGGGGAASPDGAASETVATSEGSSPNSATSSASSTLTSATASMLIGATDSPNLKPKYVPFSSMAMSGLTGLESLSSTFQQQKLEKVMVKLWEYQRYYPIAGWSSRMLPTDNKGKGPWINDADGKKCEPKETFVLPPDWRWSMDSWTALVDSHTDLDGWSYAIEPSMTYHPRKSMEHFVRRRLWQREKQQRGVQTKGPKKSYTTFFERLEFFKRDLKAEENDEDLISLTSATW